MPSFALTNLAKTDLKEIGHYTQERWGREQRILYLNMLDVCFQQLAANPLMGKDCSDIRNSYRKFSAGSHLIFYRKKSADMIEVVRILHYRMDVEMWLPIL
jgi:toxin ParE1/3/4